MVRQSHMSRKILQFAACEQLAVILTLRSGHCTITVLM
jgi:hypothetical protein